MCPRFLPCCVSIWFPRQQSSWGQHGAHLGPVATWAPCWPHEACYQGWYRHILLMFFRFASPTLPKGNPMIIRVQEKQTWKVWVNVWYESTRTDNTTAHYSDVRVIMMTSQITSLTVVFSIFIQAQIKENIKLRITGLRVGNSPVTGEFPAQRASNAENASIWCHRAKTYAFLWDILYTSRGNFYHTRPRA